MAIGPERAEEQSMIADSLLDDSNIVAVMTHEGNFLQAREGFSDAEAGESQFENPMDYFADALYEQEHDAQKLGDEGLAQKIEEEGGQPETGQNQAEQAERQPQMERQPQHETETQEQPAEVTAQSVQEWVERTEATIAEHGLNDPVSAKGFADEFCAALGGDVYQAGVNVQALGSTIAKTALSGLSIIEAAQGDLQSIPSVQPAAAKAFSYDILRGLGVDPRTVQGVDEQLLANTVLGGVVNFYHTFQRYGGKVTDVSRINDPEAAMLFLGNFMRALGDTQPVSRPTAIKVADALGNYLLGFAGRVYQANQRQAEARQGQGGRSNSGRGRGARVPQRFKEGLKGRSVPRSTTNRDIFSEEVLRGALSQKL